MSDNHTSWWTSRAASWVKLIATLGVLGFILSHIDHATLLRMMTWHAALAIGIMQMVLFVGTLFCAYRHALLITKPRAPIKPCAEALFLSASLNLVMPGRISELVKATYLRLHLNVPLHNGTAAIVIERLFDVCVVATIGLIGFVGVYVDNALPLIALLVAAIASLALLNPICRMLLPWFEKKHGRFWAFVAGNCRHVLDMLSPRMSIAVLLLTLASWCLHYIGIYLFFAVQPGFELDPWQAAIVLGAVMFAGAIPALPGGIGMVQAAVTLALVQMGFSPGDAFVLSIALHVSEMLLGVLLAPIIIMSGPTGLGHLMQDITKKPLES